MRRRRATRRVFAARPALAAALLLAATAARAHVLLERPTLRQWIAATDLALLVEFEGGVRMWEAADGSDRQEWFRVRVLEALRGPSPGTSLDFFPHAEGFPRFRDGDRALLFLGRTADRLEFLSLAERFPWYSAQGAGQEWILTGADGEPVLEIARRAIGVTRQRTADPLRELRDLLLAELGSGVASLRAEALRELIGLRSLPGFLDPGTTASLAAFADSRALPATQRLALARLLEGAPGFDAGPRLRALAREGLDGPALAQLVRASGRASDPELRAWLAALARDDPRPSVRREARAALAQASVSGNGSGSFVE